MGLGRIGLEVGKRMGSFGMNLIGFDPITSDQVARNAGIKKMELNDIWPLADYITVHTPLIPATKSKFRRKFLVEFLFTILFFKISYARER